MRIAQVRSVWSRVPDPLRPGKHAFAEKLEDAHASSVSHAKGTFDVGGDGFFDVPPDVAADLLGREFGGVRWLTEGELPDGVIKPPRSVKSVVGDVNHHMVAGTSHQPEKRRGRPPKAE